MQSRYRIPRRAARGLSIMELLVGVAVGLFVLAGASLVTSNQLTDNRRMLLETQIQQDLRAAMDIISRDIRRSGYWGNAYKSVQPETTVLTNPYQPVGVLSGTTNVVSDSIVYSYSHDHDLLRAETDAVEPEEENGFSLDTDANGIGVIYAQLNRDGPAQPLTDPSVMNVTQFDVRVDTTEIPLQVCGTPPCPPATSGCGPRSSIFVRQVVMTISGTAVHDASVRRTVSNTVRLRNDQVCR